MANINYTATADLKSFSSWCTTNVDQNASTWDSTTQEGVLVLNSGVTSIGSSAFYNCSRLIKAFISEGITSIESSAFQNCAQMTFIELPSTLTSINNGIWNVGGLKTIYCKATTPPTLTGTNFNNVTDITLYVPSEALTTYQSDSSWNSKMTQIRSWSSDGVITYKASQDLYNYTTWLSNNIYSHTYDSTTQTGVLTLKHGVSEIGNSAFKNCTSLQELTVSGAINILNGYVFQNCTNLVSVVLCDDILIIYRQTFDTCRNLTSINLPQNLKGIEESVFSDCTSLSSITFPDSLRYIYSYAFSGCTSLTSINLPKNVGSLSNNPFIGCTSLTSITVDSNNTTFTDNGNNCIIQISNNTLRVGCKNTTIPNSVTTIGNNAFHGCTGLTNITIPNSVTLIDSNAFNGCTGLTNITIPNSVTSINGYAFNDCRNLTSISLSEYLTNIGSNAFYYCQSLTSINLASTLTNIGGSAFRYCYSLSTVICRATTPPTLGTYNFTTGNDTLYVLGSSKAAYQADSSWNSAFTNIESLVVINYTATADLKAFSTWCTTNVDQNASTWDSGTGEGVLVLNNGVTVIGAQAFMNCTSLSSVTLPEDITTLQAWVFSGCTNLSIFNIPTSVTSMSREVFKNTAWWNSQSNGLIYKDNWCLGYKGSKPIGELNISNGTKRISAYAFENCTGLTSINFPSTLISIATYDFSGCTGLTSINLSFVAEIESSAFSGCTGLTSITLPESLTTLAVQSFFNCSNLTTIYWNANLTSYSGYSSTFGTSPISTIVYGNNVTTVLKLKDCTTLTNVVFGNSITTISTQAFSGCIGLTSITLPESLTTISNNAFEGCIGLTSITLPESLTTISSDIFSGCTNLTTIYFNTIHLTYSNYSFRGSNITTIIYGDSVEYAVNCFGGISTLTSIFFSNSIKYISGDSAFYNCTGLTSITLPKSLLSIDNRAFRGCTNLTTVICRANTPPTLGSSCFDNIDDTLYVLGSSKAAYQANSSWNSAFTNIKGIYTVTTSAGENGSIDPDGSTEVLEGQNITITITPEEHYRISSVLYDGLDIGTVDNFTITNIDADHTLEASFEQITYQFSTDCSDGGSIDPYGITEVVEGDTFSFSVTPDEHYRILDVTIDGVSVGPIEGYTFEDVHEGHIIYATFEHITHTITATAYEGGAIVPSGAITVNEGENQSFDIVPLEGYGILAVFIDGTQIEPVETYTFTDVEADHTIDAMFYPLQTAGFNRDEMLDIDYLRQYYLEQNRKRD